MAGEHNKADNSPAVALQTLIGTALQLPAAIASIAFFFGTASIIGKILIVPGLARQISVTDVISEAILTTPPFLVLWIGTVAMFHHFSEKLPDEAKFRKLYKYFFRVITIGGTILIVLGTAIGDRKITSTVIIVSYFCMFLSSATAIAIKYKMGEKRYFHILTPVLCTFVLIMIISGEFAHYARDYPDDRIREENLEVCIDSCHPGIVVASTGSLSAIRYWGTDGIYIVPNSDIKTQRVRTLPGKWKLLSEW
ncbi:MAG TPA: hypothetical protein DCW88_13365 [Agrobacterium sp.]|uniref:hypothetical protein n=1 Tax=Agrobacterium pusense TaxID=648995 RepID=UPI000E7E4D58|nr:hypothetical protein [Agrobacterium sp.]